jgi:hypothetical protein
MSYPGLCTKFGPRVTFPVGYLAPPLLAAAFNAASTHFGGYHLNVPQLLNNTVVGMSAVFAAHNMVDRILRHQHVGMTRGFKAVVGTQIGMYSLALLLGSSILKVPDMNVVSNPRGFDIHFSHRGEVVERPTPRLHPTNMKP